MNSDYCIVPNRLQKPVSELGALFVMAVLLTVDLVLCLLGIICWSHIMITVSQSMLLSDNDNSENYPMFPLDSQQLRVTP